jgi:carbonic anhydrase
MSTPSTPAEAFEVLLKGNRRFVDSTCEHPNQDADHRAALVPGQAPFAVLFGCSDSRLAAEIIFDQGLGDLFVVRTAGHAAGPEVLGTIEYGVGQLGAPLVVVLGHDSCGAVTAARQAAVDGTSPQGYIGDLVEKVTPSVLAARANGVDEVDDIVDVHVERTADMLLQRSSLLAGKVERGECAIAGLSYRLTDGTVRRITGHGPLEA